MSNLRRYDPEGRPVFVTFVSYNRSPILAGNGDLLLSAYRRVRHEGVKAAAWVVLPDHVHAILDLGTVSLSDAVRVFKAKFAGLYRSRFGLTKGRLWQHRFWDHIIRDAEDYKRHLDYIHYNPVRHGLVASPFEYGPSSLHKWARQGVYEKSWGLTGIPDFREAFGE